MSGLRREALGTVPDGGALEGLDAIEAAQVRRCARVLLRRPLLRADGPEGEVLPVVRRYADRLQALFAGYLGYRLVVEPGFARLYKTGGTPGGVRGAHKPNGAPFTPRAYAYLALVLAVLSGGGGQLLLSSLVADVRAAGAEAGLDLGGGIVDRRALAAALRHLIDVGVLSETDGSVSPWADDAEREALLTVDAELLGHLVAAPLARIVRPEAAGDAGTDERHAVRRRIVEDPVVPYSEVAPAGREWLRANLRQEAHLLEELTGLRLEARAEGVLAVDPEGYLTDRVFPGTGTVARIALLAADELLSDARGDGGAGAGAGETGSGRGRAGAGAGTGAGSPWIDVSPDRLEAVVRGLAERHPRAWSREAVRDTTRLAAAVAHALAQAGLARTLPDGTVELGPAAARYRPIPDAPADTDTEPDDTGPPPPTPGDGQEALFAF
ncbi:TIGR02678 family protein [Nocardiopsis sediminis]|uniref:TIGR02678 family protein n=1 Tax=Nocardiopsis sediminis TaxID=1778267 RepID=A0ABV8FVU9_9ACTN